MNITASIESSKKLKDAGFKQETEMQTFVITDKSTGVVSTFLNEFGTGLCDLDIDNETAEVVFTPTAEEIMYALPDRINVEYRKGHTCDYVLTIQKIEDRGSKTMCYLVGYCHTDTEFEADWHNQIDNTSLVESLCSLYLWCVENKYIK